jgi:carbon-monoxide dehydrogenase medium subunit
MDPETLERSAASAAAAAQPIDDVRAGADYRRAMVQVIVRRALVKAAERARERKGK